LALFLLSAAIGVWPAYDRSLCWNTLLALAAGFLLYVLISRLATHHLWWRGAATLIVSASVLLALYFVTQYAHFGYAEKVGPISRLGAFIGQLTPSAVIWIPAPNSVATFLEGGLFLAVALVLKEKRRAWRAGGTVAVGLIALALLMSASRGAWLAIVVVSVLWLALHWRAARAASIVGAVLALGLVFYVILQGDVAAVTDIPIAGKILAPLFVRPVRLDVYRNSVYLIQDFPLTGIGLGKQFAMVLSTYALLIRHPFLDYSHNLYLEVWLQQGLLGATAWLWLMVALYQAARTHRKPGPDLLYQSTWLGLTAILVHGVTDARMYEDLWCWFPFFGLLGLNASILLRRGPAVPRARRWVCPAGVVTAFLVAVLIALLPLPATWHANLGCVYQARADLQPSLDEGQPAALRQQAVDHYRQAIEVAQYDRTAQQRLGLILIGEARFHEGVEHLEVAWQADPGNTTTRKALGLAYVWVGELERAKPLLQDVPDIVYELNIWGWWRGTQQQMEQSLNA
ncbi:MAG: O-antigen ligase family protein, partial [Chloroflexi bacterium]|nr:O-antigen ligase family protein [Chloroflexota bacterium]